MKIIRQIKRLSLICDLIRSEHTLTSKKSPMLLNISPRWFFKHLEDLRELGAEIGYDRKRKTYFFKKEFDLESSIIKALKH